MATLDDIKLLSAEFPKEDIHWRAQTVTKTGDKAMALAYLDARDVMDRLDQVCGVDGWQDRYEFDGPRTVCYLSIRVGDEWITKADGAGDTQVEAEKGSISGAFKRAAVKWGIGRYLYSMPTPWVPCESYERSGKHYWKGWKSDPWAYVKGHASNSNPAPKKAEARPVYSEVERDMRLYKSKSDLREWMRRDDVRDKRASLPPDWNDNLTEAIKDYAAGLPEREQSVLEAG